MRSITICILAFFALVALAHPFSGLSEEEIKTKTWVVLLAGSQGWGNYRHQADVCHAYQAIHKLGVPDERVIVFMVDDIANNEYNPKKGQIFNEPGGPDVYAGVPKDYNGDLVNIDTFISVLTDENATSLGGSGKRLLSGPNDNVFIFFDDHGTSGAICFPDGDCPLDAELMQSTLDKMAKKKMFKNLVFYVEACFAGSVFYQLKLPKNVYVATASPVAASSFAHFEDETIGTFLADVFSYMWIHDAETNTTSGHTFQDQFNYIQQNMQGTSQTCQYGDKRIRNRRLSTYFSPKYASVGSASSSTNSAPVKVNGAVSAFDVPLMTAKFVYMNKPTEQNRKRLQKELAIKDAIDKMGAAIVTAAKPNADNHFTLPACTTCDYNCRCYKACRFDHDDEVCKFECCNEQSCFVDPPSNGFDVEGCVRTLAREYLKACGNHHDYLRKNELLFRRVCNTEDVNMPSALREIHKQCAAFDLNNF